MGLPIKSFGVAAIAGILLSPHLAMAGDHRSGVPCADSQPHSSEYGHFQSFDDYAGVVDGKAVGMTLTFQGSTVQGQLFVAPDFQEIAVKGAVEANGKFTLNATDTSVSDAAVFQGQFKDFYYCDSFVGDWNRAIAGIPPKAWILSLEHTGADEGKNYYSSLGVSDDRQIDGNALALQKAILDKDKQAVAGMVAYPLDVMFGRHPAKIKDASEFLQDYDRIFTPTMLQQIGAAIPHHMFTRSWGALLTSTIWLDKTGKLSSIDVLGGPVEDSNVYEVGYVCDTPKHHIVIDSKADEIPRYRAWINPHPITAKPDMEIDKGTETVEGTDECTHSIWTFKTGDTEFEVSQLGCTDGSEPKGAVGQIDITVSGELKQTLWCMKSGDDN